MGGAIVALVTLCGFALASCGAAAPSPRLHGVEDQESFAFDAKAAWAHLEKQCAFGPRAPGSEAHKKCRDYIQDEMKKHCENVRLQEFTHTWSRSGAKVTMWNVLGEQNWKDAKVRLVLLAHWDSRPTADQDSNAEKRGKPILGANDGASGVAVLLELMRAVKGKLPKDLGVLYLMTDGEDLGPGLEEMFLGAVHFTKNLPSPRPDYGILLDMIGDKSLVIPAEPNSVVYARDLVVDFYQNAARIGLKSTFTLEYGPTIEDDHMPLNRAGIPTMDLIDFDYLPWHTSEDTPDKCSPESLGKVGRALESWMLKDPVWVPKKRS
jgi:glutaminyl-peptide cyclotransferase